MMQLFFNKISKGHGIIGGQGSAGQINNPISPLCLLIEWRFKAVFVKLIDNSAVYIGGAAEQVWKPLPWCYISEFSDFFLPSLECVAAFTLTNAGVNHQTFVVFTKVPNVSGRDISTTRTRSTFGHVTLKRKVEALFGFSPSSVGVCEQLTHPLSHSSLFLFLFLL